MTENETIAYIQGLNTRPGSITDDEFRTACRYMRDAGVPIADDGYVWPITGSTTDDEWNAIWQWAPLIRALMSRKPKNLDKTVRPLRSSDAIPPKEGLPQMAQTEEKRYNKSGDAEVIPNGDGTVRLYQVNQNLSLESAKALAEDLVAAAKDGESSKKSGSAKASGADSKAGADKTSGKVDVKATDTAKSTPVAVKSADTVKTVDAKVDPAAQVEAKIAARHEANGADPKIGNRTTNTTRSAVPKSKK